MVDAVSVAATETEPGWTIDALALQVGMTVRTTRYYASLGLLPPPERRGRIAYYDDRHRLRLEMIRTMQERGFSLAGIEQQLSQLRDDTSLADLEVRRSMLTSWAPSPTEVLSAEALSLRAGRVLTAAELAQLAELGVIREQSPDAYAVLPTFEVSVALFDLDVSLETVREAAGIISESMHTMVNRLQGVMRTGVVDPFRERHGDDPAAAEQFQETLRSLRQLSLDAVIAQFQIALNDLAVPDGDGHDRRN